MRSGGPRLVAGPDPAGFAVILNTATVVVSAMPLFGGLSGPVASTVCWATAVCISGWRRMCTALPKGWWC